MLDHVDHVDHVAKTFGEVIGAISTDVAYVSRNDRAEQAKFRAPRTRPRWESFWPPEDPPLASKRSPLSKGDKVPLRKPKS